MASGKLVLTRHGESEWNLAGKWTGWTDVSITDKGAADARKMGELLRGIHFGKVYTSELKRTVETCQNILQTQGQSDLVPTKAAAINERNYGDYTGLNKWEVQKKVGDAKFNAIRRSFDEPIPGGDTLRDVYNRVIPWYQKIILPELLAGENILLVAHGNSMRALVKFLDDISDADIAKFEFKFGTILIYTVKPDGRALTRDELHTAISQTKA